MLRLSASVHHTFHGRLHNGRTRASLPFPARRIVYARVSGLPSSGQTLLSAESERTGPRHPALRLALMRWRRICLFIVSGCCLCPEACAHRRVGFVQANSFPALCRTTTARLSSVAALSAKGLYRHLSSFPIPANSDSQSSATTHPRAFAAQTVEDTQKFGKSVVGELAKTHITDCVGQRTCGRANR